MYDIALWLGGVNVFLVLAITIVGIISVGWMIRSLSWMMAQLRGSQVRVQATDVPKVGDLSSELRTVTNWHKLGIHLGLQTYELMQIERDHHGNERRKQEMLDLWLRRKPDAGWRDVVRALQQMEENRVAESICQKYVRGETHSIHEDNGAVGIAQKNKQKMETKFALLLMKACRKLRETPINFEDLQTFLTSCFSPGECIPRSSNINEIFEAITRHKLWDYWNYYPLEGVVQEFVPDDPELTSWIETYRQDLEAYKVMTKLIDHIPMVSESSFTLDEEQLDPATKYDKRYYQTLSFKLKMEFTDHSLKYIDDLWNKFSNLHCLPPRVALFDSICKGCISIVWLIPSHLAPQIRNTTPLADFYRKHEITRVELGEECIYQEENHHKIAVCGAEEQENLETTKRKVVYSSTSSSEKLLWFIITVAILLELYFVARAGLLVAHYAIPGKVCSHNNNSSQSHQKIFTTSPWLQDAEETEVEKKLLPAIYYTLYNFFQAISLLVVYISGLKMNIYHQTYYASLRKTQLSLHKSNTQYALADIFHIEKKKQYDFVPHVAFTQIKIPMDNPLYVIFLLLGIFFMVCGT